MADADPDNAEQPVREQLKKASLQNDIDIMPNDAGAASTDESRVARPLTKKRSHEDIEDAESITNNHQHTRKRSRDSTTEVGEDGNARKRVSEEVDREGVVIKDGTVTPEPQEKTTAAAIGEEVASPKTKRSRLQDSTSTTDSTITKPTGSGFANQSVTSPFGSLAKTSNSTSEEPQTSSSAFAASGFSALAKSSSSGFGALNKGGGLTSFASSKSVEPAVDKQDAKPKSAFGASLGAKSAFASPSSNGTNGFGSGFAKSGGLGGGFGGGSGSGFASVGKGGLSSFASGKSTPLSGSLGGSKNAKPFGAPAEDDDNNNDNDDDDNAEDGDHANGIGAKSPVPVGIEEDKKDERFYEQAIETGEEDEEVLFTGRAKLYTFATLDDGTSRAWKERGLGTIKLNKKRSSSDSDDKSSAVSMASSEGSLARLVMRADGTQRVVLNSSITAKIDVANPSGGGPPTHGVLLFMGTTSDSSKLELLQLKLKPQLALELYDKIKALQERAKSASAEA